ncbi:MAG: hypothetical protein LBH43_10850 [Treponema sp.]|nr:hypothetical protein [Treponema sp.]
MIYRKKILLLSALALLLALIYAGTFFLDSGLREEMRSKYSWIKPQMLELADRIEIAGMSGPVILERKKNIWVMPLYTEEGGRGISRDFPVKQPRVNDLFKALSRRANYPLRSVIASGQDRLGLGEGQASRIIIRGGAGLPLLDLQIGFGGAFGSTIYLRKTGSGEARSGEDIFSIFTETGRNVWYDLSLFENIPPDMVQRVLVNAPGNTGSYSISRSGRTWSFSFLNTSAADFSFTIDRFAAESWIRFITTLEADDFDYFLKKDDPVFNMGSIILELGDGTFRTLSAGFSDVTEGEDKKYPVTASGKEFAYSLNSRAVSGLFRDASYFTTF